MSLSFGDATNMSEYDIQQLFYLVIGESRISVIICTVFCFIILLDFPFIFVLFLLKIIAAIIDCFYRTLSRLLLGRSVSSIAEIPPFVNIRHCFQKLQASFTQSKDWKNAMEMREWSKVLCGIVFFARGLYIALYIWYHYKDIYNDYYGIRKVTPCHFPPEWV